MISPISIFHLLSLATNGAENTTLEEMLRILGYKNKIDLNKKNASIYTTFTIFRTIKMANALFTKFKPEPAFFNLIKKYNSTIDDLISADQINSWCSKATNNTINKIIEDINDNLMILINVIYFKGNWEKKFDPKLTKKSTFYNFNKEEILTDFMNKSNYFDYFEDENVQSVQLNYKEDNLKAIIILPIKEKDINNYIKNFNKEIYENIIKSIYNKKVDLSLPKFEIKFEEELKEILISMGMKEAFGNADFSVMKKEKDINISRVLHKTFIKVDEEGTIAAAVTAGGIGIMAMPRRVVKMIVDHPFLFIIRSDILPPGHDILFFSKVEAL